MAIIISGLVRSRNSAKSARLLTILWQFNVRILRGGWVFMPFRLYCLGDDDVIGEPRLLSVLIEMLRLCSLTSLSDSAAKELCEDRLNVSKIPEEKFGIPQ